MPTLNIGDRFVRTALLKGGRTNNFVERDLRIQKEIKRS